MYHKQYSLEEWVKLFPLATLAEEKLGLEAARDFESAVARLGDDAAYNANQPLDVPGIEVLSGIIGMNLTTPRELALLEQLRKALHARITFGEAVPTDVFVFARGEPDQRDITKIGGLPYRPRGIEWPKVRSQRAIAKLGADAPATFLGQFCFVDSRDVTNALPGDVLLIFADDEWFAESDALQFEWYPLGLDNLITSLEVPTASWKFVTCYGVIRRTVDYPARLQLSSSRGSQRALERLMIVSGTKIGGVPSRGSDGTKKTAHPGVSWRFLAQIASIEPESNVEYPWVNEQSPLLLENMSDEDGLNLVDAGTLSFYISDNGAVRWEFMCF